MTRARLTTERHVEYEVVRLMEDDPAWVAPR
jgi:hypothetical protein